MYVSKEEYNGLTKEYFDDVLEYREGNLFWKVAVGRRVRVGDPVGNDTGDGHLQFQIKGVNCYVHRVIFLMHHGYLPKQVDHKNNIVSDNRIENLREATHAENVRNCKIKCTNTSGVKGVFWSKRSGKWRVQICVNRKKKHLGYYDDLELAELVAIEAREKYHGEFARHE